MLDGMSSRAYTDFSQFAEMRLNAQQDPQESLKQVAKQFEGIFLNMMLKSMRDASFGDPLFDSDQSEMYQDMFDKQLATDMTTGKGIGLADALVLQMKKYVPGDSKIDSNEPDIKTLDMKTPRTDPFILNRELTYFKNSEEFVSTMLPYAEDAAQKLGVSPNVLVAQAALETGWGNSIGKLYNGKTSYNLFNIKAGANFDGQQYAKQTVEYNDGLAKVEKASFRAYNSFQESFDDYVNFIQSNPRYDSALNEASDSKRYIEGIHKAGYATDPKYAEKVNRVLESLPVDNESIDEDVV